MHVTLDIIVKVFFEFAKVIFFRKNFAKMSYYNYYVKGCYLLPPGVRQEKGIREFRFDSGLIPCMVKPVDNRTLHRNRASKSEASRQPNVMVLKYILAPAAVTA